MTRFSILLLLLVLSIACQPVKNAEQRMADAAALVQAQEYLQAVDLYQKIADDSDVDSNRVRAQMEMARVYAFQIENFEKAIATYESIVQNYPDDRHAPHAQFMIGFIYANSVKDLDKARENYEKFKQLYPNHTMVASADWELKNLGKSLDQVEALEEISEPDTEIAAPTEDAPETRIP